MLRRLSKKSSRLALAVSLLAGPWLSVSAAHAQDVPGEAAASEGASADNIIIVTATRRNERLVDVPASVSVLSPKKLQQSGAVDLGDYLFSQPGVNYDKTGAPGRGAITIRGVSTGSLTTPVVGVYVDDVPIGSALAFTDGDDAFDQSLLDLDRIEILRGPQGTLFGVSSLGGALRYITEKPDVREFGVSALADVSATDKGGINATFSGMINAPLSDAAAIRLSGYYRRDGGYVDAVGPMGGKDVNDGDTFGLRGAVLIEPTDKLQIRLAAQYQKADFNGLGFVDVDPVTLEPSIGDLTAGTLLFQEDQVLSTELYSGNLTYDLGFADIISVTAFQKKSIDRKQDFSDTGIFFGSLFEPFFPAVIATIDKRRSNTDKFTQEIRLVSKGDGPFKYQGGLFYTKENGILAQNLVQTYAGGVVADGDNFPLFFGPNSGFETRYEEYAGFLNVDYSLTNALTLSGGIRVAHNKIDVQQRNDGFFAGAPDNASSTSETPVTFLATARYEVAPANNIYARVASGYRAGGPNVGLVDPTSPTGVAQSPPTYDSDSLINYEIGYKGSLFDGALTIDAAAYYIDWSDIQQAVSSGNFTAFTDNAGSAGIKGAEFGFVARPSSVFSFGGTLSYIDASIKRVAAGALVPAQKGDRLPGSAKWQTSAFVQADFDVGKTPAYVRAEHSYLGNRLTAFEANPTAMKLPGFHQVSLAAGFKFDAFDLGFYVRNLTDKRGLLGALPPDVPGLFPSNATFVRPRTFGVILQAEY